MANVDRDEDGDKFDHNSINDKWRWKTEIEKETAIENSERRKSNHNSKICIAIRHFSISIILLCSDLNGGLSQLPSPFAILHFLVAILH